MDLCAIRFDQGRDMSVCTNTLADMTSHVPQSNAGHTRPSLTSRLLPVSSFLLCTLICPAA